MLEVSAIGCAALCVCGSVWNASRMIDVKVIKTMNRRMRITDVK